jgi:integrase
MKTKYPPNLYKVGDSWMIDFIYKGERYRENIGPVSRTVAKEEVGKRKAKAAEGRLDMGPKIEDLVFEKVAEKYLEWYKANKKPNSYTRHFFSEKHLSAFFGQRRLSSISAFLVEKYKLERRAADAAPATVNRELAMLKNLFNKAIEWKLAKTNPASKVAQFKEDNSRSRYLTEEEAKRFLSFCTGNLRLLIIMAMHTGFRASELRSLRWVNVDFRNGSITVESGYSKNGEIRTVPMTPDLHAALQVVYEEREKPASDAFVLLSRDGTAWKDWRSAYKRALKQAGISDFTFHDLRHCFGSYLGMNNTNPKAMMELMGHKRPEMTMRYTHLSMDYKRTAIGKLPAFGNVELGAESPQNSPSTEELKVVNFHK